MNSKSAVVLFLLAVTCKAIDFSVSCGTTCPASFTIDGAADPALTLFRGVTYTFKVNTPGHPFYIKTVAGSIGGTENLFTDGVTNAGTTSGDVVFVVPNDAPDTLHYQCGNHAAMTGPLNIVTANETFDVSCTGGSCPASFNIDGELDPEILLIRGANYAFDVTSTGHPFYIKTQNGTTGSANAFSTGVVNAGVDDDVVTFSVPYNAPNTLYFQCGVHAAMNGPLAIRNESHVYKVTCQGSCPVSFKLNGVEDPEITLERGQVYTFAVNAIGHPFYIKTKSGSTGGTNDLFTNGVVGYGTDEGLVHFTVPEDAPSVLHYQCGNHAAMTGKINIPGGEETGTTETIQESSQEASAVTTGITLFVLALALLVAF